MLKNDPPHGTYYQTDFETQGGGQCGYGPENASGDANLKWIWFLHPEVYARNRTSARDAQQVKVTYILQHRRVGSMTRWVTVATRQQTATA